jgi:hypothetical protein
MKKVWQYQSPAWKLGTRSEPSVSRARGNEMDFTYSTYNLVIMRRGVHTRIHKANTISQVSFIIIG